VTVPTTVLNGRERALGDRLDVTLLAWLRERVALRGTKLGCGEGRCGSCTVLVDGRPVLSCLMPVGQVAGRTVLTVEGLAEDPQGEEAMARLAAEDALQCGFCAPGVVVSLVAMAQQAAAPLDLDHVRAGLAGHLCRCTGYRPIVDAAMQLRPVAAPARRAWGTTIASDTYRRPGSLAEAVAIMASGSWTPVAGGTDLYLPDGPVGLPGLLDLSGVTELADISESPISIRIGATSTYRDLIDSPLVRRWCVPLAEAAAQVGGAQVQNQGTIGGALAVASPASDVLPALAVLSTAVELRSASATRIVPYRDFVHGPGTSALGEGELITAVVVDKRPTAEQAVGFFRKVGGRRAQAISTVSVAVTGEWVGHRLRPATVCFGAVEDAAHTSVEAGDILASGPLDADRVRRAARAAATPAATSRAPLMEGLLLRGCYDVGLLR
jgi:xanthine dehydrogenase small subunit